MTKSTYIYEITLPLLINVKATSEQLSEVHKFRAPFCDLVNKYRILLPLFHLHSIYQIRLALNKNLLITENLNKDEKFCKYCISK